MTDTNYYNFHYRAYAAAPRFARKKFFGLSFFSFGLRKRAEGAQADVSIHLAHPVRAAISRAVVADIGQRVPTAVPLLAMIANIFLIPFGTRPIKAIQAPF
jgi:hypothetical protein